MARRQWAGGMAIQLGLALIVVARWKAHRDRRATRSDLAVWLGGAMQFTPTMEAFCSYFRQTFYIPEMR
jgi:hypothetical protein